MLADGCKKSDSRVGEEKSKAVYLFMIAIEPPTRVFMSFALSIKFAREECQM